MVDKAERLLQEEIPDGGWTDQEIEIFMRRAARFQKFGMTEMDAEKLAQTMLYRDRPDSGDHRRLCLECKQLAKGLCKKRQPVLPTVLQCCDFFQLKGA